MEISTLLRIREILEPVHLQFSVLFNNGEDGEGIVVEFIAVVRVTHDRPLLVVKC